MAPIYSIRILAGASSPGSEISYPVPTGFVYVIRDIECEYVGETSASGCLAAFLIAGSPIVQWPFPGSVRLMGSWRGRGVAEAGELLSTSTTGFGGELSWRVSGYALVAP